MLPAEANELQPTPRLGATGNSSGFCGLKSAYLSFQSSCHFNDFPAKSPNREDILADRRDLLWVEMLDAEMYSIYWDIVYDRQMKRSRVLRVLIGIASCGALSSVVALSGYPDALRLISGVGSLLSAVSAALYRPSDLSSVGNAAVSWGQVAVRLQFLWADDPELSDPKKWASFQDVSLKVRNSPNVRRDDPLLLKAQKLAAERRNLSLPLPEKMRDRREKLNRSLSVEGEGQ